MSLALGPPENGLDGITFSKLSCGTGTSVSAWALPPNVISVVAPSAIAAVTAPRRVRTRFTVSSLCPVNTLQLRRSDEADNLDDLPARACPHGEISRPLHAFSANDPLEH